jgi:exopolysaccharide biosynthesis polyprenyl glycosylphosphotransferase
VIAKVYYYNVLLRIGIYLFPVLAFGFSSYIRFGNAWFPAVHGILPQSYLLFLLFTEFAWVLAAAFYKISAVTDLYREHTGVRTTFLACFATFCMETALLVFLPQVIISRLFIVLGNVILFLLAVAARNLLRVTSASSSWSHKSEKIVVVGTDDYAIRGVELLRRIPFVNCEVQAYLQLSGQPVLVHGAPVIHAAELFAVEALNFNEAVVAVPPSRYLEISPVLDYFKDLGKPVRAILDLGPRLSVRETLFQVGALQLVNLAISPVESFAYTVLKRTFDLVFATFGLVVLSPVMLTIAVLIKLFSRGPVLFLQERVGRNGKRFNLLKFRTMHCLALSVTNDHWTTRNDAGCTKIGAVLRKFSLDELPQLLNVIRGDMSLVGPRPERPHFVSKFRVDLEKYNVRHCCEVGMTGWAQVNGLRGDTSISDRLRYDLYYIQNWSFGFDIRIIARTMLTILKDQNAY